MFVVGVLKYGERVWALMCASNCVSSSLPATRSKYFRPSNTGRRAGNLYGIPSITGRAYALLDVARQLFEGPTGYVKVDKDFLLEGEEILEVAEMQLSMMYDFLYTKAAVVHTWYGFCIRAISLPATVAALGLFHRSSEKHGYNSRDVIVTYVLLGGAVLLETTSVLKSIFSSWTSALLWLRGRSFGRFARVFESALLVSKWSGYMGQQNLFTLCARGRNHPTSIIAGWMGWGDWWNSVFNSWSAPVPRDMIKSVSEILMSPRAVDNKEFDITNSRGQKVLTIWSSHWDVNLEWSIKDFELDECILIWHIATHLYLTWCRAHHRLNSSNLDKSVEALSNYMFFLLAARPYMLPNPINRQSYVHLCYDVINWDVDLLAFIENRARISTPPQFELERRYADRNKALERGCRIATILISKSSETTMKMLFYLWLEMLCYTAYRCDAYCHAKHLSDGGEVMTTVSLLMMYRSNGLFKREDNSYINRRDIITDAVQGNIII
uniref:Uncharacterized protein n=1 Tax=Avena sativa TaxID=4498 RepID=A0ACD5XU30_AVESA